MLAVLDLGLDLGETKPGEAMGWAGAVLINKWPWPLMKDRCDVCVVGVVCVRGFICVCV